MRLFRSSKTSLQTDIEIITSYKVTDDKNLIGLLFDRHAHLVYGICYHYLKDEEACKDAVLAIFEKMFEDLHKYDIANFSSWLHSVTRNYCFAYLNKENVTLSLNAIDSTVSTGGDDSSEIIDIHLEHLNGALNAINPKQKQCIELFYLGKKSYDEIASVTGYSMHEVKSYIQNGKRNLKIYLERISQNEK